MTAKSQAAKAPTSGPYEQIAGMAGPLLDRRDIGELAEHVGYHRIVGIGSVADGAHESHRWRTALSRTLIEDYGFRWVGVDWDWPDCRRINQWLSGQEEQGLDAGDVLARFDTWPAALWANDEVMEFLDWLHHRNRSRRSVERVGLFGLDHFSLWRSLRQITGWLQVNAPDAPGVSLHGSLCCLPYQPDPYHAAASVRLVPAEFTPDVVDLLIGDRRHVADNGAGGPGTVAREPATAAAEYYRTLLHGGREAWNARERHLADAVQWQMQRHGSATKGIVWAHNTHLGDARGTDMARHGVMSMGELLRTRLNRDVFLVGFAAHRGTVLAADSWSTAATVRQLPAAVADSHEDLLFRALDGPAVLIFGSDRSGSWLSGRRGQRAVGLVYRPDDDQANYVKTWMGGRYDALVWVEETTALPATTAAGGDAQSEMTTFSA